MVYRMEKNFDGRKIWQIYCKNIWRKKIWLTVSIVRPKIMRTTLSGIMQAYVNVQNEQLQQD